ncbi:MAG: matrixin family metalloprotease, partial [Hyphomicrobiales bacterium]
DTAGAVPFVLNFDALDGEETDDRAPNGTVSDGDDVIFGDLGHDWLVGGTGRDHLYGGFGDDLLNADDDHATDAGQNQSPDTDDSYADIAFGGGGRDILIGNTGGDRLIDWAGEFNSYIVPFAPFGAFTISRTIQPQIFDYLYDLSEADGADPTRDVDGAAERNGEPYGELGAVKQQDPFWQDQTGAPDDPQPGNIPGGRRDVMAAEDFNSSSSLLAFAADSGEWTTSGGKLAVSPTNLGEDAVSVYHLEDPLPGYFELVADISVDKDKKGFDSNGFLIFDYQGPTDFKFAGLDQKINKLQIGHRDADGWHVDVQANVKLRHDTTYRLLVAVNGTTVTAQAEGIAVSHTFEARLDDGVPIGLNQGLVGLGAFNATTRMDNLAVQVLPPDLSYEHLEDFETGAGLFTGARNGDWSVADGVYTGTPAADGIAFSLYDLSSEAGMEPGTFAMGPNSKVKLTAELSTADTAGLIFDVASAERFKFAVLDVANDRVLVGHFDAKVGWVVDADASFALDAGRTYEIALLISGTTVSLEVDGTLAASHAFNGVAVDGAAGLVARGGPADFASLSIATDDPKLATEEDETDALSANSIGDGGEALDAASLPMVLDEAARRLALMEGLSAADIARLRDVQFAVVDLQGDLLATENHGVITFDIDGAGHGYFVDDTPTQDEEFFTAGARTGEAIARRDADGVIDLLSVAMHELGHVLGFDHAGDAERAYMAEVLDTSQRLGLLDPSAPGWFVRPGAVEKAAPAETKTARHGPFNGWAANSIDLRPVLAQASSHTLSFDHLRSHGAAASAAAQDNPGSNARVFDETGGLLLDPEEARLLRALNFEVSDLVDNEDGTVAAEDGSANPATSKGLESALVRWTEKFDGLKSL